jgi:hypothetical protein
MSSNINLLQVFIASPSDLVDERRAIKEIADSLNMAFGSEVGLQVQLLGWEDRLPGYGRPQAQINEDVDKADLFIGFLWRRWGTDPGNAQYTSGFEEEFNRALQRRESTGAPEICLFFKAIDEQSLRDPGDQLKRVLDFKQTVERSQKVLFRNFATLIDWKEQTRELLQRHLLKLLANSTTARAKLQPQAPPASTSSEHVTTATASKRETSSSASHQQVIHLWDATLEAIKRGELTEVSSPKYLDSLQVARLGLMAASITNRKIEAEMPTVHALNLLYKNRKQFALTRSEWILVLRANLASQSNNQPGWFWLGKIKLKTKAALTYLACQDGYAPVRLAAIGYAKELALSLAVNGNSSDRPLITPYLESKSDAVRRAALACSRRFGTVDDAGIALKIAGEARGEVAMDAARVALHLAPGDSGSAITLLKNPKPELMKLAMLSVLNGDVHKIWPLIRERLYDDTEEIRTLACAYTVRKLPPARLRTFIDQYMSREHYFYNVVFFLDRAVYAKGPLKKVFIKEIEAVLT